LNRTSTVTDFNRYALELVHLVLTIHDYFLRSNTLQF
jgi:hypothetical protein